jgi:uncharacterized membrane protein
MTYGQPGGGSYGPRRGQPYGQGAPPQPPYGQGAPPQPPYGQGAPPQPPYGRGAPQQPPYPPPPQYYAPPQHPAPSGPGRPPRGAWEQQPSPYTEAPAPRRRQHPADGPVSDEDERWAVPAYVGMFVTGFIAPAIVLAARGRTSPFARFHAVQALNLFIAMAVCTVAAFLPAYLRGVDWLPLTLAVVAADCACVIRAAITANRREWRRLPAILAWPIVH